MKSEVTIIVLNWNGKEDTLECLETLQELRITNYELRIIMVDNGSIDGSVKEIRKYTSEVGGTPPKARGDTSEVKLIQNKENLGFTGGNNIGIKYALETGADYVMLLNNDTLVDKNLVEELLKVAEEDKNIGILGPKIYFAAGYEYHKDIYKEEERGKVIWYAGGIIDWQNVMGKHRGVDEVDHGQYDKVGETDYTSGCCMMVRKEVLEKIGFLNERYFMYFEDLDFCVRTKKAGFKIVYVPGAVLWHKNAQSAGKPGSPLHNYYLTRNRLLFGFIYAPFRTKLALFRESLKNLFSGGEKRKAMVDFYLKRFGKKSS